MTIDVVILDDRTAEVHFRPGWLLRLFGVRHTYSPIVLKDDDRWYYRYTLRSIDGFILRRLERLAPSDPVRQHLLLQAADEADDIH